MTAAAHAPTTSLPSSVKEHQEESAVRESAPNSGSGRSSSESRASRPPAHFEPNRPFRLHGARVSITQSPGTTRFYVLKVLDDGEALPSDGHEAFILLADPNTKLSR